MEKKEMMDYINKNLSKNKTFKIFLTDPVGNKVEIHFIPMPEDSANDLNGTVSILVNGNHVQDTTFLSVQNVFDGCKIDKIF